MCAETATHECTHCGLPLRYFADPNPTDIETSEAWCGITPDGDLEQVCFGVTAELFPCPTCWGTGAYVDADMHGEVCDLCDGSKVIADHAPTLRCRAAVSMSNVVELPVAAATHSLISISERGTWQTASCACSTGVDHIVAVAA
jgi:hypothetical protein